MDKKSKEKRPKRVVEEVVEEVPEKISEPETPAPIESEPVEPENEPKLEEKKRGYSTKTVILVALITALLVGALAGGVYVYMSGISRLDKEEEEATLPSPTATATPEPTPTASPEAEIDLASFKVSVLNGSGKIGEATKVKNLLTKAGFTISSTGNAKTFDFTDTVIEAKEDVPQSVIDTIKEALADYSLEIGETLTASNSSDIVVTVGSK